MDGGGAQQLLSLNPTIIMVVLLLGFWLLLGCDNSSVAFFSTGIMHIIQRISYLRLRLKVNQRTKIIAMRFF